MKLTSVVLAAVLSGAFGSAFADTINIDLAGGPVNWSKFIGAGHFGGAFSDTFTFSNYSAPAGVATGTLVNTVAGKSSITFTSATLNGVALDRFGAPQFGFSGISIDNVDVTGPLTLVVNGVANVKAGGTVSYGGDFNVSAVPEPATYGMLVGGMGVLAFAARRRKQ